MTSSLIFLDARLQNRANLLKQLPSDSVVIELNANQDGLQQFAELQHRPEHDWQQPEQHGRYVVVWLQCWPRKNRLQFY